MLALLSAAAVVASCPYCHSTITRICQHTPARCVSLSPGYSFSITETHGVKSDRLASNTFALKLYISQFR